VVELPRDVSDPEKKWIREIAGIRLARRLGMITPARQGKREALAQPEMLVVQKTCRNMWATLSQCPAWTCRRSTTRAGSRSQGEKPPAVGVVSQLPTRHRRP